MKKNLITRFSLILVLVVALMALSGTSGITNNNTAVAAPATSALAFTLWSDGFCADFNGGAREVREAKPFNPDDRLGTMVDWSAVAGSPLGKEKFTACYIPQPAKAGVGPGWYDTWIWK